MSAGKLTTHDLRALDDACRAVRYAPRDGRLCRLSTREAAAIERWWKRDAS